MNHEALSAAADALLSACERDRSAPFYTETGYRDKIRHARRRESQLVRRLSLDPRQSLVRQECVAIVGAAGLTPHQREVLTKRWEGATFEEIGLARGHSKQGAMNIYVQAMRKIARASDVYPYRGLSDVYRDELTRGTRARPYGRMKG
ncbi:MAG: hypothetical protein ACK4XJ_10795 [Fimbriimonadaceae bacterium]